MITEPAPTHVYGESFFHTAVNRGESHQMMRLIHVDAALTRGSQKCGRSFGFCWISVDFLPSAVSAN